MIMLKLEKNMNLYLVVVNYKVRSLFFIETRET